MLKSLTPISVTNTLQHDIKSASGVDYRIFISWPLTWRETSPASLSQKKVNMLYVLDGNALFYSTMEDVRRKACMDSDATDVITVGIGYPIKDHMLWNSQRSEDLTPPCEMIEPPLDHNGKPSDQPYGGADRLLAFIRDTLTPFIQTEALPGIIVENNMLLGHSYGGLFTLHALFTHSDMFDTYIAISPSIWWNARFIDKEEASFKGNSTKKLVISYGSSEQHPVRKQKDNDEDFERSKKLANFYRMKDNAVELHERLLKSGKLGGLNMKEYPGETHASVIACGINGGISYIFDE